MWTPRRVLLLLGGVLLFGGVYAVYARSLGWLDGLPQLPPRMLDRATDNAQPPQRAVSPTVNRLIEAFGPNCPESRDDKVYETRLEFRNGESSVVVASGPPPANPNSSRVTLAPFSAASFGKPRPAHLRAPGEVTEITTFHADKAVLEFDRIIHSPNDMSKAKLLRLELVSEPEQAVPDPRRGMVHVTNNQRAADPNKRLVLRTAGPVFYRDPKNVETKPAAGPDIWTDAGVEIVDKNNLPRGYAMPAPATAEQRGEYARGGDFRTAGAVPDVLAGRRLPPPTVTAVGMRIYLEPEPVRTPGAPAPVEKKTSSPYGGVRRVELLEKVLFNLWVDAQQGFVAADPGASAAKSSEKGTGPLGVSDPPQAAAGVVGGPFYAVQTLRRLNRALLQVETLGPFAYDMERSVARFDVVPQADPNLPNDVQVHRLPPKGGAQRLFSQVLEIEFNGPITGEPPKAPAAPVAPAKVAAPAAPGGPSFKRMHAWTYTPGRYLTVSSDEDRLEAFGDDLVHEQAVNRTTLRGAPLYTVRGNEPRPDKRPAGGNVLTAGGPQRPAFLDLMPGPGADKSITATVRGPGRLELYDAAAGANTIHATWLTSLAQTKENIQGRDLDLFTFTDGAKFEDKKAGYWLKGNVLKLWLEHAQPEDPYSAAGDKKPEDRKADDKKSDDRRADDKKSDDRRAGGGSMLPHRVQAIGDVASESADIVVERADHLNVLFREGMAPPTPVAKADAAKPAAPPSPGAAKAATPVAGPFPPTPAPAPEESRPKPPMRINSRLVDTWVVRYPVSPAERARRAAAQPAGATPDRANEGSMKYELEKARCEGTLQHGGRPLPLVHQEPTAPDKPRGVDVFGQVLLVDHTPDGSVMTVTGTDQAIAQVHHEGTSILGPKVVIDQLLNKVEVAGRGSLVMPAGSDLTGGDVKPAAPRVATAPAPAKPPAEVVVHWRDEMTFNGATRQAEFVGRVRASQGESYVVCHTMQVVFDRPVYFNQARRPADAPPPKPAPRDPKTPATPAAKDANNPKIEVVYCYPAPEDDPDEPRGASTVTFNEVTRDDTGRVVKSQHVTAHDLVMKAQEKEPGGEPYQLVLGTGPGTVRVWQVGQKDDAVAAPPPPAGAPPGTPAPKPAEPEMKLTVVQFGGRMAIKDKAKIYQQATFSENIEVIHAPADDPAATIDRHRLPRGASRLTCAKQLVLSVYKKDPALPPAQRMDAYGNAYIRSDEYDGWGETITSDGRFVVLNAGGDTLARIYSLFKKTESTGRKITYDRQTGGYGVDGSSGATIQQTPGAK